MNYRIVRITCFARNCLTGELVAESRFAIEGKRWNLLWVPFYVSGERVNFPTKEKAQAFIDTLKESEKPI